MRKYIVECQQHIIIARCFGQLTLNITGDIKQRVKSCAEDEGASVLALDLSKVRFIDSSGIGMLVALQSWAQSKDMSYRLLTPSREVVQTLELVRLKNYFHYVESADELKHLHH